MLLFYIMINRYYSNLDNYIQPGKVLIIYGPRRVGKTTLIKNFLSKKGKEINIKIDDGGDISVQETLSSLNLDKLRRYVGNNNIIVIDEAQYVPNIGQSIKLLVDHVEGVNIILSGSSSLSLGNLLGEPLTGRSIDLLLYPISQLELSSYIGKYELEKNNEEYLIFGSYPEVLTSVSFEDKAKYLLNLVNSYIFKDILSLEKIKGARILLDLLRLLAFQIGNEVSLSELASSLSIDSKTVARYLDLLEKSFIIYRLGGFSRNLRSEVTNKSKYFFFDNGVRNAIINNFNTLNMRDDVGKLWENFLIIERTKRQKYLGNNVNPYFWRTYEQNEIDYIEEAGGILSPYEFKYSSLKKNKGSKIFEREYPQTKVNTINKDNYIDFVCLPDDINFTNLSEFPNGRYLLQIEMQYPYIREEIGIIINNMKSNSSDEWILVKKQLEDLLKKKVKEEDTEKFKELIEGIRI